MNITDYLVIPKKSEFKDWSPVATEYRLWVNTDQSTRIYENNGKYYIKLPNSDWRRVRDTVPYKVNTKTGIYETVIDIFPPIIIKETND